MSRTYNGWTNYETWAVALWLDNDSGSYEYWRERATFWANEPSRLNACYYLSDEIEEHIKENSPLETGMYADLLGAALCEVHWLSIAEHMLEGLE